MSCLDENTVARVLDRKLTAAESAVVISHIDGCDDCRRLMSALARGHDAELAVQALGSTRTRGELSTFARAFDPAGRPHVLDLGSDDRAADTELPELGRYRLTRCLGRGAMGAVYAADDPELGREIAIKLVPLAPGMTRDGRERRLVEAKALAKVSHPNVIAIYDVGTVGDQLFIAMELVRGGTLREWLATRRGVDDIVRLLTGVARGLQAAHASGLVHRDVKPENILVEPDGRARVGDFGLVLHVGEVLASADVETALPPETLTQTGTIVGTPAYMAPEQFAADPVDARSDQFSFCVMLHEAVYGVRPFAGTTIATLTAAIRANTRQPIPTERRVPRWLRTVIDRGLAVDAGARYRSMDELVIALSAGTRRRRAVRGGVLVAAGVTAGVFGVIALRSPDRGEPCAGVEHAIEAAWNPTVRTAITDAFAATGKPFATDTAQRVTARLDDYSTAWTAKSRDVCAATNVRADQAPADMELRNECLAARRDDLAAVVKQLTIADVQGVAHAVDVVAGLGSLGQCDDLVALRQQQPPAAAPEVTARRAEARKQLSKLHAMIDAGQRKTVPELAQALVDSTRELQDPALHATATRLLGQAIGEAGQVERARTLLESSIAEADRAGLDGVRATAWAQLIVTLSAQRDDLALAKRLLPQAEAAIARLGTRVSPSLEVDWLLASGVVLASDDPGGGAGLFRQAAARAAATFGKTSPPYLQALSNLAGAEQGLVSPQSHVDTLTKLAELHAQVYGEHSPLTAVARMYRAEGLLLIGKPDDAASTLRIAISDLESAYGADAAEVANACSRLSGALQMLGKLDEALAQADRALAIRRKRFPPDNPFVIESLVTRGRLIGAMGKWHEAVGILATARETLVKNVGPTDLQVADADKDLGYANAQAGDLVAAEATFREELAIEEARLGKTSPALTGALRQLGTTLVAAKRPHDAIAPLERALAMLDPGTGDPLDLADVQLQLAYALPAADRARALGLAKSARATYDAQHIAEAITEATALVTKLSH